MNVVQHTGGQGVLGEDTQARSSLAQAARTTVNAEDLRTLDYLITCTYSSSTGQLLLLAGNNDGAVGCFPVTDPVRPGMPCGLGSPQTVMSEAHDAVSQPCLIRQPCVL